MGNKNKKNRNRYIFQLNLHDQINTEVSEVLKQ